MSEDIDYEALEASWVASGRLVVLAQHDHGLRPADDLMRILIGEMAYTIINDGTEGTALQRAESIGMEETTTGEADFTIGQQRYRWAEEPWREVMRADGWCDDPDHAQWLYDEFNRLESCMPAGIVSYDNSDCGTWWLYDARALTDDEYDQWIEWLP